MIPDLEQKRDIDKIIRETSGASADFSTPGSGKTIVALKAAQGRGVRRLLVIAPLGTRNGWRVHAEAVGYDLPFYWVQNTKAGQDAMVRMQFGEDGIFFVGPELATSLAWDDTGKINVDTGKKIKKRNKFWESMHFDFIAIDEVHKGTVNTRSQRHKFYAGLNTMHLHALSGTPHGQNFEGIYGVTKVLWPDLVPKNLQDFKRRYCETEYDHFAWDNMKVIGEKNPGEFFGTLPCVVRRVWKYEGIIDEDTVWVDLSAAQAKAYRELEKHMVTMIDDERVIIEYPTTLRVRLRQASLGMFYQDQDGSINYADDCKSTKLDALNKVLTSDFRGETALIVTDSKRFAKVTVNRIRGWGFTAEEYSGDVKHAERDAIRTRFRSGETQYVVMVIKAGGTGVDEFQYATRNMCWLSQDDSRVENEQALARTVRRGQGGLVRIRYIVAAETFDAGIMSKHIQDAIAMNKSMRLTNA